MHPDKAYLRSEEFRLDDEPSLDPHQPDATKLWEAHWARNGDGRALPPGRVAPALGQLPTYASNADNLELFKFLTTYTGYFMFEGDPTCYWQAKSGLWAIAQSTRTIRSADDIEGIPHNGIVYRFVQTYYAVKLHICVYNERRGLC